MGNIVEEALFLKYLEDSTVGRQNMVGVASTLACQV
jgi:hypothetical protein